MITVLVTETAYDSKRNVLTWILWVRAADLGIFGGQESATPAVPCVGHVDREAVYVNGRGQAPKATYRYTYDNAGNRTGQSDPAGRGITYFYNVRGGLAARQYTAESYRYTADGLLYL